MKMTSIINGLLSVFLFASLGCTGSQVRSNEDRPLTLEEQCQAKNTGATRRCTWNQEKNQCVMTRGYAEKVWAYDRNGKTAEQNVALFPYYGRDEQKIGDPLTCGIGTGKTFGDEVIELLHY